jgi:hypothetical protein
MGWAVCPYATPVTVNEARVPRSICSGHLWASSAVRPLRLTATARRWLGVRHRQRRTPVQRPLHPIRIKPVQEEKSEASLTLSVQGTMPRSVARCALILSRRRRSASLWFFSAVAAFSDRSPFLFVTSLAAASNSFALPSNVLRS